ncbi:MAG: hypothetical protein PUD34_04940 [bacterium]|nr:hypothetical protein [bacterium]
MSGFSTAAAISTTVGTLLTALVPAQIPATIKDSLMSLKIKGQGF